MTTWQIIIIVKNTNNTTIFLLFSQTKLCVIQAIEDTSGNIFINNKVPSCVSIIFRQNHLVVGLNINVREIPPRESMRCGST